MTVLSALLWVTKNLSPQVVSVAPLLYEHKVSPRFVA